MVSSEALRVLKWLADEGDDEYGYSRELVHEGRAWMIGVKKVPGRVANELILWCCIKRDGDDTFERWMINGTGREMLKDPQTTCSRVAGLLSGTIKE